jgi:hypothetical protein
MLAIQHILIKNLLLIECQQLYGHTSNLLLNVEAGGIATVMPRTANWYQYLCSAYFTLSNI